MKKIYGLAALAAAMTLASCSNNDEPNVAPTVGQTEKCYISVNLTSPKETRSIDYVNGTPQERAVKNVKFVLFDKTSKKYIGSAEKALSFDEQTTGSNVEQISGPQVIEIDKIEGKEVGDIMTIINCPSTITFDDTDEVATIRKKVCNYLNTIDGTDYYVMTNSAYNDGTKDVYATNFEGKVFVSLGAAQHAEATDIYVERVAAKVEFTVAANFGKSTVEGSSVDYIDAGTCEDEGGVSKAVKVDVTGYGFIYETNQSYFVKNIDGLNASAPFTDWNNATDCRSHWGVSPTGNDYSTKPVYYLGTTGQTNLVEDYANIKTKNTFYLNENVNQTTPTYVVVTGEIKVGDGTSATEVYRLWNNGKLYTESGVKNQLCGYLHLDGYKLVIGTESRDVTTDEVKFTESTDDKYSAYLTITIPTGAKLMQGDTELSSTAGDYNLGEKITTGTIKNSKNEDVDAKNKYRVYKYGGGKTYYYVAIQPDEQGTKKGVVRNHYYKITLNSIIGIGTPLFDPTKDLLPQDPDPTGTETEKWHFNAAINTLGWAIFNQEMNFK